MLGHKDAAMTLNTYTDLFDDELDADVAWTRENVLELAEQWRRARGILDRIGALTSWLEADPALADGRIVRIQVDGGRRDLVVARTPGDLFAIRADAWTATRNL